jgi:alpha-ribazole phosphatase
MEVILVRHGRTAGNLARLYNGRTDEPLCEEGVVHANASGADPGVLKLYVSPLKRARETARIKFPNAAQIIRGGLREMDFGDFEGRSGDEMQDDPAYKKWVESFCTLRCPNGDKIDEYAEGVCAAFDEIVRECIEQGDTRLVIVAHGGTLMSILSRYARPERQYYEWYVDNCCGYRCALDAAKWDSDPVLTDCALFEKLT